MRGYLVAVACLSAAVACDATVDIPTPLPGNGGSVPAVPDGATAEPFTEVVEATTAVSAITERERLVITNASDWEEYWVRFSGTVIPRPPAPTIDFTRFRVATAAMGSRPTGGYGIEVTEVRGDDDALYAVVLETSPGAGCVVTQATTAPAVAVRIPLDQRPVLFAEKTEVRDCS